MRLYAKVARGFTRPATTRPALQWKFPDMAWISNTLLGRALPAAQLRSHPWSTEAPFRQLRFSCSGFLHRKRGEFQHDAIVVVNAL